MIKIPERIAIVVFVLCIAGYLGFRYYYSVHSRQTIELPDKPFKLPNGSIAYPSGTLATPIHSKEERGRAHVITSPVKLLDWLRHKPNLNLITTRPIPVNKTLFSDQSKFLITHLAGSESDPDPQIFLKVIEPNANASLEELGEMKVTYMGRPTTIRSCQGPFDAPETVRKMMALDKPKWQNLSMWVAIIDLDHYEIEGENLLIELEIEYTDKSAKKVVDTISGSIDARFFKPLVWPTR